MKNWRLFIGILVSVVCLYLAARGIDLSRLLDALGHLRVILLVPAVAILLIGLAGRALRWRGLLASRLTSTSRLFRVLNIGYLFNNVFPLRAGDVLRAYLCAELEGLSAVRVLSTVALERLADTLTIVVLLFLLIPFVAFPGNLVRPAMVIALAGSVAIVVLALMAARRTRTFALYDGLASRVPFLDRSWLRKAIASGLDGLVALGSWRSAAALAAWSFAVWLCAAVQFYIVLWATGLRLPFVAAIAVLCVTTLGMAVPSSPGYIGVFEYLAVITLSWFGVSKDLALGYALVSHALSYLAVAALGIASAWREGYSYLRLRGLATRAESARRDGT